MSLDFWKKLLFFLLPKNFLWSGQTERPFTKFIEALASAPKYVHDYLLQILTDIFPRLTTREDEWSKQLNYATEQTKETIEANIKEGAGQSPNHLQEAIQNAGFTNVFVHEWWRTGNESDYIDVQCGDGFTQCGGGDAYQMGGAIPITSSDKVPKNPFPYINDGQPNNLLVNPVQVVVQEYSFQMGGDSQCGDLETQCETSTGTVYLDKIYPHSTDYSKIPYNFFVGGESWPDIAVIPTGTIKDLERIIYKIKPLQQRCVLLVEEPNPIYDIWQNVSSGEDQIIQNVSSGEDEIIQAV